MSLNLMNTKYGRFKTQKVNLKIKRVIIYGYMYMCCKRSSFYTLILKKNMPRHPTETSVGFFFPLSHIYFLIICRYKLMVYFSCDLCKQV